MSTSSLCFSGVVILYNPNEDVFDNIKTYAKSLDRLWVVDNTENDLQDIYSFFVDYPNIIVIQDGVNKGIGARINFCLQESLNGGYKWLLMMDQDSSFTPSNLSGYLRIIRDVHENKSDTVAQVGITYTKERKEVCESEKVESGVELITSGTFINLRLVSAIGLMNEDLFIDEVDTDFSYRVILNKKKSLVCNGVFMIHHLGEVKIGISFKNGKRTLRTLHSATRLYYITRNYLWVRKRYRMYFKDRFAKRDLSFIHIIKNNILYNSDRFKVIGMVIRGYIHYRKGISGRVIRPN